MTKNKSTTRSTEQRVMGPGVAHATTPPGAQITARYPLLRVQAYGDLERNVKFKLRYQPRPGFRLGADEDLPIPTPTSP